MKNMYLIALVAYGLSALPAVAQTQEKDPALRNLPESMYWKAKSQQMLKELPPMPSPEDVARKNNLKKPFAAPQLRAATAMKLDSTITMYASGGSPNKIVYTYNEQGQMTAQLDYYKYNNVWELNGRIEYLYDAAGNRTSQRRYLSDGELWIETLYTYNSANQRIKEEDRYYEEGKVHQTGTQEYDASGYQILNQYDRIGDDGEWYTDYKYVYDYNEDGYQTLYEYWDWNGSQLQLLQAQYREYDAAGRQTSYKQQDWDGAYLNMYCYRYAYDAQGRQTLYEYTSDYETNWSHQIETWSYNNDNTGIYTSIDSTLWKEDNSRLSVSAYSSDCTYDEDGRTLTEKGYVANPATGERGAMVQSHNYTYNAQGNMIASDNTYYSNGLSTSRSQTEYEYAENGRSYEMFRYDVDLNTEERTLEYGEKYDYTQIDVNSYSYIYSEWNVESKAWEDTGGYKYEYTGDDFNFERFNSEWNSETDTWVITDGRKYINESDGAGNQLYYDAYWDTETNAWSLNYGYKTEMDGDNPQIETHYDCVGTPDDWELSYTQYSYYSELLTANETLTPIAAMKVYSANGSLRIETTQAGTLSVYNISGGCVYNAPADGTAEVNNLSSGIYIVRLQTAAGVETVKVWVK